MNTSLAVLLDTAEPADLGPGPRSGVQPLSVLQSKLHETLAAMNVPAPRDDLIRATIFLWHDHLDAAHELAQAIDNRDGSYVHAIMHRREPDYGNAKYWFRRVGQHSCFAHLAADAEALLKSAGQTKLAGQLMPRGQWDAFVFVDACEEEAHRPDPAKTKLLRQVQRVEFQRLLEYFGSPNK